MHSCRKDNGFAGLSVAMLAMLLALLIGLTGCGGGGGSPSGGGGGGNVTILGRVLDATTVLPPTSATITINGKSANAKTDGTFTLTGIAESATTATVTSAGEQQRTLALHIPAKATSYDLGDIYMSATGYTASASGTVVTPKNGANQVVVGASVTIAGTTVLTAADGTFNIPNLPVGLGTDPTLPIGKVQDLSLPKKFADKPIYYAFVFVAGDNPLGSIVVQAGVGAIPGQPYTVFGHVTHTGTQPNGFTVEILSGGIVLGTPTQTDTSGNYYFWVAPGDYTVIALSGSVQSAPVAVHVASADGQPAKSDISF